jgi:hypothetical protein
VGINADTGYLALGQQKLNCRLADPREMRALGVLPEERHRIIPKVLPAGVHQHHAARFDAALEVRNGG